MSFKIILKDTHTDLVEIEKAILAATDKHNAFLKDLGLDLLPGDHPKEWKTGIVVTGGVIANRQTAELVFS